MKNRLSFDLGAESGEDATISKEALQEKLNTLENRIKTIEAAPDCDPIELARLMLKAAWVALELHPAQETWMRARPLFNVFFRAEAWSECVEVCDLLFLCDEPESIAALGQGVWLSVTFPMDPGITYRLLRHVVEETPDNADGAAVAASTAVYVYQLREEFSSDAGLYADAMELLTSVARQHSGINTQEELDAWMEKLELDQPEKFLVRLRNVIDVLVQENWWFDRDAVQSRLPED